jgi:deoxyribodipyrimidine photo-lyase
MTLQTNKNFQGGGNRLALFRQFCKRTLCQLQHYLTSRKGCSRLSPYLAYGISMRMIYQYTNQHYENSKNKRDS